MSYSRIEYLAIVALLSISWSGGVAAASDDRNVHARSKEEARAIRRLAKAQERLQAPATRIELDRDARLARRLAVREAALAAKQEGRLRDSPGPSDETARACLIDAFEDDDSPAVATPLALGTCQRHEMCDDLDDWVRLDLQAGDAVTVTACPDADGDADTVLSIFDPEMHLIALDDDGAQCSFGSSVSLVAPRDGAYLVHVTASDTSDGAGPGLDYELCAHGGLGEWEACAGPDVHEPDDDSASARPVQLGSCQAGDHCDDPGDWVQIDLTAGETYHLLACVLGSDSDTVLRVYDAGLALLAEDDESATSCDGSELLFTAPTSAPHFIEIASYDEYFGDYTEHSFCIDRVGDASEPDDVVADARPLAVDTCRQQDHSTDAVDWLSFTAVAGVTYELSACNLGAGSDTELTLFDPAMVEIGYSDDDGRCDDLASHISFTAAVDGEHFLLAGAVGDVQLRTEYEVCVRQSACAGDSYEPDDSAVEAQPIAAGECQQRDHCDDEVDWLQLDARADHAYVVSTCGLGALADTALELYGPALQPLAGDDDGGRCGDYSEELRFVAEEDGPHYLEVPSLGGAGAAREYTICLVDLGAADAHEEDDSELDARPIAVTECQQRNHLDDDQDWVQLTVQAGETYRLEACNDGASDVYLDVYDPAGQLLTFDQNSATCAPFSGQVSFTARATGTYLAMVGQLREDPVAAGSYQLCLDLAPAPTAVLLRSVDGGFDLVPMVAPMGHRYVEDFVSGSDDPEPGIVDDASRPLVTYQIDSLLPIRLTEAPGGHVRIDF